MVTGPDRASARLPTRHARVRAPQPLVVDLIPMRSDASRNELQGWPVLVGGGLMNIALGTYYAWSVFVPTLEREFGWSRTQTSLVPTIDMVTLSSMFVVAG